MSYLEQYPEWARPIVQELVEKVEVRFGKSESTNWKMHNLICVKENLPRIDILNESLRWYKESFASHINGLKLLYVWEPDEWEKDRCSPSHTLAFAFVEASEEDKDDEISCYYLNAQHWQKEKRHMWRQYYGAVLPARHLAKKAGLL